MGSFDEREPLRGKIQCIYFDPPYGIKFNSNWQPSTKGRDVKDGKEESVSREPEVVRALRDTWKDGIHSYLSYLRDRLTVARDLLSETGSVFVQIGDENLDVIKQLLAEIFGQRNFISIIPFVTTGGRGLKFLDNVFDYLVWFAKDRESAKFRPLYLDRELRGGGGWSHSQAETPTGERVNLGANEIAK